MKKDSQQKTPNNEKKIIKTWDLKTLKENFGGLKKIDPSQAGLSKEIFFKFSFSY